MCIRDSAHAHTRTPPRAALPSVRAYAHVRFELPLDVPSRALAPQPPVVKVMHTHPTDIDVSWKAPPAAAVR
eukprot:6668352-Prymnesium_polylepis.1